MAAKDYYAILGVSKTASEDDIKKAFRRLAHEHHPDKGGDQQKFKDVNEAYQILSDKQKRATYDKFGSAAFEQGGAGGAGGFGGGFGGFQGFGGFNGQGFDFENAEQFGDLGDILGQMFGFGGAGGGRSREPRGNDIQIDAELSFHEAVFGVKKTVSLYKHVACHTCSGSGAEPGSKLVTCDVCKGAGEIRQAQRTLFGTIQTSSVCSACHGQGKKPEKACHTCKGVGIERTETKLEIPIPAGVSQGEVLKMPGQGEMAPHGRAGDVYIRLRVKSDPRFRREEFDILSEVHVPYTTLVLGGDIMIETVDGEERVKVHEHTPSGTEVILKGKGVPNQRGSRGQHRARVIADVPKKLSKEQRRALEALRDEQL